MYTISTIQHGIVLFVQRAVFYAQTAYSTAADMFVLSFHMIGAFVRIEKFLPVHTRMPCFTADSTGRAHFFADIAVGAWVWRQYIRIFKRCVSKYCAQSHSCAKILVQEQAGIAYTSQPGLAGDSLVGISAAVQPAFIIYALACGNSYKLVSVLLQQQPCLQQTLVYKKVYCAVVIEIRVCRLVFYFVNYSIRQLYNNAHCVVQPGWTIFHMAEAHVAYAQFHHSVYQFFFHNISPEFYKFILTEKQVFFNRIYFLKKYINAKKIK